VIDQFRQVALAVAWLVAAALLAFGAAGIVAGFDHLPGPARPELTHAADRAIAPVLDRAVADLAGVAADVEALGAMGRRSLAALSSSDEGLLDTLIAEGVVVAARVEDRAAALRLELSTLPALGAGAELRVGAGIRARHAQLLGALDATAELEESWAVLTAGALAATRMTAYLEQHVAAAFAATEAGRSEEYDEALARLDDADAALADAVALRDRLAPTIETATLDEWLRRNGEYDAALRALYTAFRDSGGRVTQAVRNALAQEQAARAQLPEDNSGLLIIVAEIGRGGANQAVIEIEESRALLGAALDALRG
jgi:hypothetical protein